LDQLSPDKQWDNHSSDNYLGQPNMTLAKKKTNILTSIGLGCKTIKLGGIGM